MPHIAVADATSAVAIQHGAIVSKVIHRDGQLNVTVFGLDAGEELTQHRASSASIEPRAVHTRGHFRGF